MRTQRVAITVTRPTGSTFNVEPWCGELKALPGEFWEFEGTGPDCGCGIHVAIEADSELISVWGWTGSTLSAYRDGKLVERFTIPVPGFPGHRHEGSA